MQARNNTEHAKAAAYADALLRPGEASNESFGGYYGVGCGGTTDSCKWNYPGSTGMAVSGQAPQADVVVGVTVVYAAPYTTTPSNPIIPVGGSPACVHNSNCAVGMDCVGGVCVTPAPPVIIPGVVYGVTQLLCASAEKVASGSNTPTKTVDLSVKVPLGSKVLTATLSAASGAYALDGFSIAYSDDGATQLAATYRQFAHGVPAGSRTQTAYLPATATAGSLQATIGCSSSSYDLYLSGLGEAQSSSSWSMSVAGFVPQVGALNVGCTDFSDVFQMPDKNMVACCKGGGHNCWWGPGKGYLPQTKACDAVMAQHCRPLCAGGSCTDPACNCLGSPLAADGTAQCFDAGCADDSSAYRTKSMYNDPKCPGKNLTCAEYAALGAANVAKGVVLPMGCGGSPGPPPAGGGIFGWLKKNPIWAVVFVVFVILLAFALMPSSGGGSGKVPKLPPGALPKLPSLGEM